MTPDYPAWTLDALLTELRVHMDAMQPLIGELAARAAPDHQPAPPLDDLIQDLGRLRSSRRLAQARAGELARLLDALQDLAEAAMDEQDRRQPPSHHGLDHPTYWQCVGDRPQ